VYADPNRYKPIAIVVPAEATLSKLVAAKGLAPADTLLESLVQDNKVVNAVLAELLAVGKRGGLTGIEMIQGLVLVSEEWTPENVYPRLWERLILGAFDCCEETKSEEYSCEVQTSR
jgi:long-chain acyl-CoA synthetase